MNATPSDLAYVAGIAAHIRRRPTVAPVERLSDSPHSTEHNPRDGEKPIFDRRQILPRRIIHTRYTSGARPVNYSDGGDNRLDVEG